MLWFFLEKRMYSYITIELQIKCFISIYICLWHSVEFYSTKRSKSHKQNYDLKIVSELWTHSKEEGILSYSIQNPNRNGSQYHQMFCLDKRFLSPSSCAGFKGVLKM